MFFNGFCVDYTEPGVQSQGGSFIGLRKSIEELHPTLIRSSDGSSKFKRVQNCFATLIELLSRVTLWPDMIACVRNFQRITE